MMTFVVFLPHRIAFSSDESESKQMKVVMNRGCSSSLRLLHKVFEVKMISTN